jgi:hypothetical protein
MKLAVNRASMGDLDDRHSFSAVVDFINQPIIADANAPRFLRAFQQLVTGWAGVVAKRKHSLFNFSVERRWNGFQFSLSATPNAYGIAHLRLRRISSSACSKGIGFSPEAFSSSYSRTACRSSRSSSNSSYSLISSTTATRTPFSSVTNCLALGIFLTLNRVYSRANQPSRQRLLADRERHSSSPVEVTLRTARNASCGMSTWPTRFMRFLPSFCFSRSLRLRVMSPP